MWPSVEGVAGLRGPHRERGVVEEGEICSLTSVSSLPLVSCQCFIVWGPQRVPGEQGVYWCGLTGPELGRERWRMDSEGQNGKSPVKEPFLYKIVLEICRCFIDTGVLQPLPGLFLCGNLTALQGSVLCLVWCFSLHWVKICLSETPSCWSCSNSHKGQGFKIQKTLSHPLCFFNTSFSFFFWPPYQVDGPYGVCSTLTMTGHPHFTWIAIKPRLLHPSHTQITFKSKFSLCNYICYNLSYLIQILDKYSCWKLCKFDVSENVLVPLPGPESYTIFTNVDFASSKLKFKFGSIVYNLTLYKFLVFSEFHLVINWKVIRSVL